MRVLFQPLSPAQTSLYAHTRDALAAQQISSEVSNNPQVDLSEFALVHFFGFEPLPLTLRCVLNAITQQKPFVITPFFSPHAHAPSSAAEIQEDWRALERAAQQLILHQATYIFVTAPEEGKALNEIFELVPNNVRNASIETYIKTYRELARSRVFTPDELSVRALEDTVAALGTLTYSADAYYYREFTPQLERDAQRAGELQVALLEPKRRWIWERR